MLLYFGKYGDGPLAGCKLVDLPATQAGVRFDSDYSPPTLFLWYGPLAQLAEQATLNRQVEGSIPSWPTNRSFHC